MSVNNIDGNLFKKMIVSGANALHKNKDKVDALNVFPVPDGDTGTNMSLTFLAAAKEATAVESQDVFSVAKAVSNGSLRGARGNSGVILSQLFRGFAKGLENCEVATNEDIANAFSKATEMAYKAVMKPKEGTILTIAKAMSEKANEIYLDTDDVETMLFDIIKYGKDVLKTTTEMLPALKQAGVVDAGGEGLLIIWEAAALSINSNEDFKFENFEEAPIHNVFNLTPLENIKFAYCTEFFIIIEKIDEKLEDALKNYLLKFGDSIVVVVDDKLVKVHVHTNNPGVILEKALTFGFLDNLKIENMKIQHTSKINFSEKEQANLEKKDVGVVSVANGDGFKQLFESLGVDFVVSGGQTMNPSTEDFISAIKNINAEKIIILPNNKNIILSATQSKDLYKEKNISVIPTTSMVEGISCMVNFDKNNTAEENVNKMKDAIKFVKTGQITYAVRDTKINGKDVLKGDFLSMKNGELLDVNKEIQLCAKSLISSMIIDGGEFLTIYYGEDANEKMAQELADYIEENYKEIEVEIQFGGQTVYNYIFSLE